MAKSKELYELSLKVLVERPLAIMVTEGLTDGDGKQINHWLPKSQIQGDWEVGKVCTLTVPAWLVEEKGLTVE